MKKSAVRFGIFGAGNVAHLHAKAIHAAHRADLVAVLDRDAGRARIFADRYGIRAFADPDEFFACSMVDAVTVATPSGMHADSVIAAAHAGKHVLCEKPLDIAMNRVDEMICACRSAGVLLLPVLQYRYLDDVRVVKQTVESRSLGELLHVRASVKWFRPASYYASAPWRGTRALDGGGCLMNQGIHTVDLMTHFAGAPREVFGYALNRSHPDIEVEDTVSATVRFENGTLGILEASTCCAPGSPAVVELSFERGTLVLSAGRLMRGAEAAHGSGGGADPADIDIQGHCRQVEDLVGAIREGSSLQVTPGDARTSLGLVKAVYESSKTGRPVRFHEPAGRQVAVVFTSEEIIKEALCTAEISH